MNAVDLIVDVEMSTATIGARHFPAALVICPPDNWPVERTEWDRSLGGGSRFGAQAIIPAENGVLFDVEMMGEDRSGLSLKLTAATCERVEQGQVDETETPWIWLPHTVSFVNGDLVPGWHGTWEWSSAEPEWVIETIDRLSHKPFEQPPGPLARLVRLDYFADHTREATR